MKAREEILGPLFFRYPAYKIFNNPKILGPFAAGKSFNISVLDVLIVVFQILG